MDDGAKEEAENRGLVKGGVQLDILRSETF